MTPKRPAGFWFQTWCLHSGQSNGNTEVPMRKLPPLNAIRAFEAAARNRSFTAAARELCVTVTAISHQVRHLEAVLGLNLFERTGRAVVLSPTGERLFPCVRAGLDTLADAFADLNEKRAGSVVTVATTRAFAERWLIPRLAGFYAQMADITVNIEASEDLADLSADGVDLAIRYGPINRVGQEAKLLFEDNYIAVTDISLAASSGPTAIEHFRGRPLLSYRWRNGDLGGPDWSDWLAGTTALGERDFRISRFNEETLALQALDRGVGPLLCSDILVAHRLCDGSLRLIQGPELKGFAYRLVGLPRHRRKRGVRVFADWVRAEADASKATHHSLIGAVK